MKKLVVISGKGGTGKTTLSSAFIGFSSCKTYGDCDVDAPNLHITRGQFLESDEQEFIGSKKAKIHEDKCISCGKCQELCRFGAIEKLENGKFKVNELFCEGCQTCYNFSGCDAISLYDDVSGYSTVYKDGETIFSDAKLKMGRGNSGKLVSLVKSRLSREAKNRDNGGLCQNDLMIIDGAPGIGCVVIASLSAMDMALIVAEPSNSGISDLERIVKTARGFGVKIAVCINKADLSPEKSKEIKSYAEKEGLIFAGEIPYDKEIMKAVNMGKSIDKVPCKARESIFEIYQNVIKALE